MLRYASVALFLVSLTHGAQILSAQILSAQAQTAGLTEQQRLGQQVLAQSCGVCHLPPSLNARTYGPRLSRETAGGNAEIIRVLIAEGSPRMPGFKHYLDRAQMDAIVAYLTTVPPPPPAPATPAR